MNKILTGVAAATAAGLASLALGELGVITYETRPAPASERDTAFHVACSEAQRLEALRYGLDGTRRVYVPLAKVDAAFAAAELLHEPEWPICDRREPI